MESAGMLDIDYDLRSGCCDFVRLCGVRRTSQSAHTALDVTRDKIARRMCDALSQGFLQVLLAMWYKSGSYRTRYPARNVVRNYCDAFSLTLACATYGSLTCPV